MARKGNPISEYLFNPIHYMVRISIVVLFLFSVFTVCYFLYIVLGFDLSLIGVKLQSMLLFRSFRFLCCRLLGWEVPLILLLCLLSGQEGYTLYMEDPAGGEGGSGAGPSQRRGHLDLNLPPGSGDELSDLVAELDQVEREIRRLSESRIESTEGLEARQERLARLKTVLAEVDSRLDQARERDRVRDNERARLQAEMDHDCDRWRALERKNAQMRFQVNELILKKRGPLIKFK